MVHYYRLNLLDNAVKYGSSAELQFHVSIDSISIHVLDCGPGIPASALDAVFLPFVQVEGSPNRSTGGCRRGPICPIARIRCAPP